jgi:ComF family protein
MVGPARIDRLKRRLRNALCLIENAVIPNGCVFCGDEVDHDATPACGACVADLPWIAHSCKRCGSPVPESLPDGVFCGGCQLEPPPFETVVAPLRYRFPIDAAIKALKFHRALHYAPAFASILAAAADRLPPGIDGLLPVPLHWRRQAMRGFNQAAEICAPLQRLLGVPTINVVRRSRATPFQSGLAAAARRQNLRGAFAVHGLIAARHVLIVDDVVTTGTTCEQLASVLQAAGVRRVSVLAVARAATKE